jgi:signal transduction histidine kinase
MVTVTSPSPRATIGLFTPRPGALIWAAATVIAVALAAVAVPIHAALYGVPLIVALTLGLAHAGSVPLALVRPRTAAIASVIAVALTAITGTSAAPWPLSVPSMIAQAIVVLVIALRAPTILAVATWLASVALPLLIALPAGWFLPSYDLDAAVIDLVVFAGISGVTLAVGLLLAGRENVRAQLVREKQVSAAEQTRRELVEERARIARELHDVVAHSMSVIQVQATTARYRLPGLDDDAVQEFETIAASARTAMGEMRRLLGVLRDESTERATVPQPGVDAIGELIESARRAGVPVSYRPEAVPSVHGTVSLTAYRIVQEALSNVIRHAPGAETTVTIDRGDDARLHISVENAAAPDGAAPRTRPDQGGHGLIGMRERAALLGGSTSIGRTAGGGFRVEATLPLDPGDEEQA